MTLPSLGKLYLEYAIALRGGDLVGGAHAAGLSI